jgi:hypothetical protein
MMAVALWLFGDVVDGFARIDETVMPSGRVVDAPASLMWRHSNSAGAAREGLAPVHGMWDVSAAPRMALRTDYYPDNERFEIQGRHLLLEETAAEAPVIHYIAADPPVTEWPATFADAVALLIAARLAPRLAQSENLAAALIQKHEMSLGKARSKDTRETRSKENHGPRAMAARSGLVRARYGSFAPPFAPAITYPDPPA